MQTAYGMGGFPSGQRGQTVNLLQIASVVRIHLRPLLSETRFLCRVFFCLLKVLRGFPRNNASKMYRQLIKFFNKRKNMEILSAQS